MKKAWGVTGVGTTPEYTNFNIKKMIFFIFYLVYLQLNGQ